MKKRICSLLLICSMLAGLLPQIVLPQAAAADTAAATDGFGLPTEEKTGIKDTATLRNNPYGTLGWVPLFQNHELVVAGVDSDEFQTTYEGAVKGKGKQMSTFRWSNSTDVGNAERIATVAFDPNGTGKDEYIANLVFDKSSARLHLYVTNKDRRVSKVVQIGDGNDSEYIKKLKFYQTRAMLCLTAGDFDGDGKDTLMVYTPGNNEDTATVDSIKEYTFSGSTLTDNGRVINLGDVIDGGRDALKAMLYHDGNGDNELRAHLSVDMEVGDVDMDGIDELAMTVNVNDLKEKSYDGHTDYEKSYLTVYDYNNNKSWKQMMNKKLLNSNDGPEGRARFAGVTIGYVSDKPSGTMPPEVVAVGYYDKKNNYQDCEFDRSKLLAYSYQYSTKDNSWTEKIKATEVVTNGFTNTGTKGDDVQNPIAVAAVAADGVNTQEYLFISGSMYKVDPANGKQMSILEGSDKGHDRWLGGRLINNSGILDYAVGNFDGNKQGREQVYYVEYRKQETFDKQFLKIGQLYKGSTGSTFTRWEDDWTYYDKSNCNLALTTADVNNDAMLAKIQSVSTGYTDPKVMAILEASPHFAEVNDGDIGNSQTGIGYSKDNTITVTASGSFGFDIMAGFEYVAPLIETGGGVEFNTSHTFTVGATKSTSKEITVEYSNDTNDNMVLMYATPMTYYEYQVKYPDDTMKGNSPKLTSSMTLAVPGNPSMNMVSVDTYNKAASAYEGMQQIGSNLHLGTSGQPNTYRSSLPSGSHSEQSGKVGHYKDSGTQLQSFTAATSSGVNFEYTYEGSVQMYGVVGGFKAGGGYHWGASAGTEKVNTETITKLGSVTGGGDSRYNFDWSFGTWTVPFNGDEVPVLGYVVSNVTAPPSPAQDLSLSEQTTNSMVLSWESGDRPAEYYKIYRYLEGNKEEPFVLIDTVDAAESSSGQYEYTLKDLAPNTKYQYAITSGYYTSQEESVESEIIAGTTLANDKSRPNINGPDNATVQMNDSATFEVLASVPAEYSSTRYQWQQRLPGKKWGNIAGATTDSYTVKSVTSDLNGAMYRCVVTCYDGARTPISFYSDAATLTVGTPQATAGLTVSGASEGSGTQDAPYIGQSNFNTVKTTTESVKTTVPCTVEADGMTLDVYEVNDQAGTVLGYVGIGEKKVQNSSDDSISTVYYAVTKNGETYTAGAELTMNTTYQWKNGETAVTVPSTITPETVVIDKNENENAKAKAKAFTLDSATNAPTDAEYDESKYRNGEQYLIHGTDTVTENGTTFERYILSKMDKSTSGAESTAEDTYTVKYYQLLTKANNSYELTKLTCTQQTKLGDYTDPSFTLVTEQATVENKVTTSTPGYGTALTLTTKTAEKNGAALGNVEYTLTITNTSDGTVSTIVGRTNSNGTDSKTWTAPTAGLYAITTTATGGLTSDTVYYLAGVQSVKDGETNTTETVYTLKSTVGNENKITSVYGTPIDLTVQQQTVTKNGSNVTAGSKTEVQGNITYTWRQSGQSESPETAITGSTFRPAKAGTYIITAYQDDSDTSKRTKLASTTITVKRKPLELVIWNKDNDTYTSTEAPDNKSALVVKADALESGDALPSAITAACALYDDKGNRKNVSGRFEVTIAVNGEDAAVKSLLEKYELNLTKRMLVVKQDTLSVTYHAGEGGSLSASYKSGDLDQKFESGKNIAKNTKLMFDAKSNDGFLVKEWKVNGQSIKSITGNTEYKVTEILSNGKKVGERLTVAALTEKLDVEVAFSSDSHTIIFSSGKGGELTAALKDGGAVTTGQKIAEGANVTFTAAPNTGMSVARWMVDDKPYYWPGTTDLYRESTLTLENVQKDRNVKVEFSSAGKHKLTFNIESETGSTLPSVQTSAKLADGTAADLNAVPDGAAVTFALENLGSNYTVKTWKVDGKEAANSGTQKQFTLRNIMGPHTVTAVINAAQEVTLTFKAVDAKGDPINADAGIASVTAKIKNGNAIASGSTVGNYSTIEFAAAVNENYYVSKWTGAEADAKDSAKASIVSLEKTTDVIAYIAEKPKVTVAAPVNGTVEVAGTRGIQNVTLIGAADENGHVNMNSTAAITATPRDGCFVKSIIVTTDGAAQTFDYDNAKDYQPGEVTKGDIQITKDTLVQVIFAEKPTVTFGGDTHITVTAKQGNKTLSTGDHVEKYSGDIVFAATPDEGYETDNWNVTGWTNVNGAENDNTTYTRSGSIESNVDVHATSKALPQYDFTLSVDSLGDEGDGGTVSAEITRKGMSAYKRENLDAGKYRFYRDSDITITAVPSAGYRVQDWTINGQTTADTATSKILYNLQGETTVQVRFVKLVTGITFGPTDKTSEGGYLSEAIANGESILKDAAAGANIAARVPIQFMAEVKPGYEIEGWYINNVRDDSAGTGETYTYPNTTSASSIYIAPKFQQVEYDITTGDNVTVNGQNSTTARGGESLTFTAVPPAGQNVTGWTVNGESVSGSGNTLTWTVANGYLTEPNVTSYHVAAQFSAGAYSVTYTQPANGKLTASVESGTQVNGGTKVAFAAEPDEGYEIDEWTVNGHSVANSSSTYTLNVTENSRVAVTFKAMVPVSAVRNGRNGNIAITANGKTITDGYVSSGSDVTFTVTPENTDDMVQAWQVNGSTVAEMTDTADAPLSYTVQNVTTDTEVSATLIERPTYTITVTSEGSGTASAEPASVKRGGSTTVTAVPSSNSYYLKEWSVNGGAAQAASGNTLALTEIRRNTTVKAVFDGAINYDVTLDVQGAETGTTVAATANGKAITPQKNSPASVTRGSRVVFTATPAVKNGQNKQMVAQWTVNGVDQNNISNELVIPSLTGKTDVAVKFVPYEGFTIPTGGTGWKVSDVKRVPDDTQPTSEIRKNGTVTFTATPDGERLFRKLTVGGVDCLTQPKDGNVTAVKNGTAYTITVKDVTSDITVDAEAVEYQVASSTLATVPTALKGTFDSLDKLKSALRSKVNSAVTEANTTYLDIVLQYKSGTDWVTVTNPADFPEGGIDVKVLYSTLSATNAPNSSYNFSVVHMFTTTMNGQTVGGTESLTSTKQSNGITFHVNSLSPFAIGWYKNTSTGGGGGGGGGGAVAPTTYDIVIPSALANTVKADKTKAAAGDTVTLTAAGEGTLTVTDANGKTVALTDLGSGKYTFKMPSAKVSVSFKTTADQPCDGGKDCPSAPFTDVDTAKWYHLSVDYVLTHKMMNGVSSRAFAPNANLTRGMLVQILYNLEGKPKGTAANFSDVQADAWYAEAIGWAASNKVVTGYADGTFRPNAAVTREQAAAILYRYAQSKGIDVSVGENTNILSYVDVQQASEYAIPALQWAVGAGVLNGKNGGRLVPTGTATRAEIAAIMQRWCENIIK